MKLVPSLRVNEQIFGYFHESEEASIAAKDRDYEKLISYYDKETV
jgi:hypothetical protein